MGRAQRWAPVGGGVLPLGVPQPGRPGLDL